MPWFEQNWAKHACWRCSSQPYVEHCRLSARSCSWHSGWRHARSEDRGEDRPRGASVGEDRAETGAKTGAKTGSKTGAKTAKTAINIWQKWELEQASVCSLHLFQTCRSFRALFWKPSDDIAHFATGKAATAAAAHAHAWQRHLATWHRVCHAQQECAVSSSLEETPFFNDPAPLGKMFAGMQGRLGMQGRAGQARYAHSPGLLQHPYQSRAARQQTPASKLERDAAS